MPDWMTHIVVALIFCELFNVKKKSLVLLGALLPDFLVKLHLLLFYLKIPTGFSLYSLHTPFMTLLVSFLIIPFFRYEKRKVFALIYIGAFMHILLDSIQTHYLYGQQLFFPLSMQNISFNLIWPEQSFYVLGFGLILYILIKIYKKHFHKT